MRFLAVLIVVFLACANILHAQEMDAQRLIERQQEANTPFASLWLNDYRAIILVAVMIMALFVALMYFAGHLFENEQIKILGKSELVQAGATILIVIMFLGFVQFVDEILNYTAGEINTPCLDANFYRSLPQGITTLNKYAACYVDNLNRMAIGVSRGALYESVNYASESYRSVGGQSDTVSLVYLGWIYRPNAHYRLDSEIKRLEFQILAGYITSLSAQLSFLFRIVPILGPGAVLLGLILRSFFFTRKLGGLMLASGAALMIVFPAMYLLAWFTLQVQAFGPQAINEADESCPQACKIVAPWGYRVGGVQGCEYEEIGAYGGKYTCSQDGSITFSYDCSQFGGEGQDILLDNCMNGPSGAERAKSNCEAACLGASGTSSNDGNTLAMGIKTDPSAYGVYSMRDYNEFVKLRVEREKEFISANKAQKWLAEEGIQLCYPDVSTQYIDAVDSQNCAPECRILPMQAGLQCNATACDKIPLACKAIRPMDQADQEKYCSDNKDSEFYCSCRQFCQIELPQVKEVSSDQNNPSGIVPTANANKLAQEWRDGFSCDECPSDCRAYISDINPIRHLGDGLGNVCDARCKECMKERVDGKPDLMYGIPSVRNSACNDRTACGPAVSISDAIEGERTDVCPLECRINFASGDEAYKDPVFLAQCEDTFKDACNRCSDYCKVDSATVLSAQATCVAPPKYYKGGEEGNGLCTPQDAITGNCLMDKKVNYNCARCPEPCRFVNPPSINYKSGVGLFYPSSHYYQTCEYIRPQSEAGKIKYSGRCNADEFKDLPGDWLALTQSDTTDENARPPACSPYSEIYRLNGGQEETCPQFIFPPKETAEYVDEKEPEKETAEYVDEKEPELAQINLYKPVKSRDNARNELSTQNKFVVEISANPNVASVCANEDAQKFCQNEYCSDQKCKVDRERIGPTVCAIDTSNQYSQIPDNGEFCAACYTLNDQKTKGPQCQVYLSWEGSQGTTSGVIPAGCAQDCDPQSADPKAVAGCVGFCYPRLIAPSGATCENYNLETEGDENRAVENCAACPIECRYDYKIDVNGQTQAYISQEAAKKCGLEFGGTNYGIDNAHNCDLKCRGVVPAQGMLEYDGQDFYTYCTQNENYECEATSATNGIWVRNEPYVQTPTPTSSCNMNVVVNDTSKYKQGQTRGSTGCTDQDRDGRCDKNWFDESCQSGISFTYSPSNTYYTCAPQSKYAGVDEFINEGLSSGAIRYYECGEIHPENTEFNLCSNVGAEEYAKDTCADTCDAQYNARAIACLEGEYYHEAGGLGTSVQEIGNNENCNTCPFFCRASFEDGGNICDSLGVPNVDCSSTAQCDLRLEQSNEFPNPIGYCAIDAQNFKLEAPVPQIDSWSCAYKQPDEAACPLRCRIELQAGMPPSEGCDGGEVGAACKNLKSSCKLDLPDSPCLGCSYCPIESCTQKPKVWTDCSLCAPQNYNAGASAISPADLVSSMSGARGTNTAWRTIGALGIPAIVLPILAIIATLAIIRSLSPIFGGDIEIPGLMKLI